MTFLKRRGAVHEEVYGFERPRFFARGIAQEDHYSFNRTAVDDMVEAEVKAVRNSVGIMDVTAFTKVLVEGSGGLRCLGPVDGQPDAAEDRIDHLDPYDQSRWTH